MRLTYHTFISIHLAILLLFNYLCLSSYSRVELQILFLLFCISFIRPQMICNYQSCPDKTHFTLKNINQLRKFINACCSQYLSNWSNSGVILSRIRTATLLLCPYQHRTKFINFKQLSLPSSDTSARSLSPSATPYHCPHWPLP